MQILFRGGQPGENPTIRIRGVGSINASASPLIILDGAPFNGNINTISADQIENISVLKDASSTALYGSRGANGVILITTKRGRLNTPTAVNFRNTTGIATNAVDLHEFASTDKFTEYTWEGIKNTKQYVGDEEDLLSVEDAAQFATDDLISTLGYNPYGIDKPVGTNGKLTSTNKLWDTDWYDLITRQSAKRSETSIGISGGSKSTTYSFSANYLTQDGLVTSSNFERIATRLSIDSEVNKWFKTGLSTSYSTSSQNFPTQSGTGFRSAIQWVYSLSSFYPVYQRDSKGKLVLGSKGEKLYDYGNHHDEVNGTRPSFENANVVAVLDFSDIENIRDNITLNGYAQINILKDFNFKTQVSYEKYLFEISSYDNYEFGDAGSVGGRVSHNRTFASTKNIINSLNYKTQFSDNVISLNLIHEAFEREISVLQAQGTGFLPNVKVLDGSTTPESVGGSKSAETLNSYLGRLSYAFKDRYFLESSFRQDESSRFSPETRKGSFYSVGAAYVISDENFLKDIDVISNLKIRVSHGELGNNRTLTSTGANSFFPYLSLFATGWNELDNIGVLQGGLADSKLTWEKTATSNFGVDFGFFNKIVGSIDYYTRESIDLIYNKPLAPSTGNTGITTNVGSIKNSGIEIQLSANVIDTKNIGWRVSTNFSFDKNEITALTQDEFINGTKKWEVGRSLYDFFMREWAGVDPVTGYGMWYKDILDADDEPTGERETTTKYADATRYYAEKQSLPNVIGGFSSYLKVKDFDLNILFNFSLGAYVYDSNYAGLLGSGEDVGGVFSADFENRWKKPGDIADVPLLLNSQNDFNSRSTRFLFKNDYLRLRGLTLGYNLPTKILDKINLSKFRVYFQGDNLLTLQSHKGIDPEQSIAGTTNNRSYNQRILSLGLNVQF